MALQSFAPQYLEDLRNRDMLDSVPRGWVLTKIGYAILTEGLQASAPEDVAYLADAQMATLSARLATDGRQAVVQPFLQAARNLLLDAKDELGDGDPVRWGAAVRAVHNAVVMDLDRPNSLRPEGRGIKADVFASLVRLADNSSYSSDDARADFDALTAALPAREHIR